MFLSMIKPGPNSSSRKIDVYLRLFIDKLKQLWSSGALIYNVSRKQNFLMKATLIWTINNFSVCGMISSWNTHRKLAYSYCMENNKAFTLTNNGKTSFFDCHQWFLPIDHNLERT